ncbi:cytochrome c oxidase assembly protein [Mesorhizobium sp. CO1-1-8]|uniref:cytochrome c oxidase assembly protein n=1 Tax=Mesorhizobium sp. CO1-1-8 TaxID=2876631 RepID=UPI001CD0B9A6|nr:cytochrome c oxidase assembly protein [Mesorhizobium sp. CO1-1-8]MBZ9772522.1 cytochrome c oxidase assembly protein [Mesorhizobium sp. CO1-1-8]
MSGSFTRAATWLARRNHALLAAAIFLIGTAEMLLVRMVPASLPFWMPYEFSWGVFLATAFAVVWYARGFAITGADHRPSRWRRLAFFLGVGLIYGSMQTYADYAAQHMFFIHRLQHLVLHHSGPFLVALGDPAATIARGMPPGLKKRLNAVWITRPLGLIQQPAIATFLFVGLIYLWPAPPVHFYAMLDPRLYTVMNWSVTIDGLLFWALILDPRPKPLARLTYGSRALLCFAIMPPQILIGAVVAFATKDFFEVYAICGRILPMTGLQDQQLAGLILWIPGAMMSVVGAVLVLNFMRLNDEKNAYCSTGRTPALA